MESFYVHPTASVDTPCSIGAGTKIWHYTHLMPNCFIGKNCILGQNVYVSSDVQIGNHVKVQNNVSIFTGVELEDYVFCGPSCVFTNVTNPRAEISRHDQYKKTIVKRGATIGANATIICGTTIGRYAFVAAGSVIVSSTITIPDYALMIGVPAKQKGWISRHGHRLTGAHNGLMVCPESNWRYREVSPGVIRCLDWPEDQQLS